MKSLWSGEAKVAARRWIRHGREIRLPSHQRGSSRDVVLDRSKIQVERLCIQAAWESVELTSPYDIWLAGVNDEC